MLYNLDTTGGNSGSPVLDAYGNLIGVNFDRAFTATINDFAWNEDYSRSIGVDIRYVLYVMKYIGKTDRLIDELNVKL
jgi:S1-C subfamily serine protease